MERETTTSLGPIPEQDVLRSDPVQRLQMDVNGIRPQTHDLLSQSINKSVRALKQISNAPPQPEFKLLPGTFTMSVYKN